MKFFRKQKDQFISQVVILSMVFGFAAGVVGQIVADVYINPWRQDYLDQSLNTKGNLPSIIPELRRVKKFLGIQQDFEVNNSITKAAPALAGIYLKKSGHDLLNQIYLPQDLQANGFVLTSDGWLISQGKVFDKFKTDQLVVVHNNIVFSVDNIIKDSTTGIVFLKVSASNLSVVVLGDSDEMTLGQLAIALNNLNEAEVVNIKSPGYQAINSASDFITSSEGYKQLFLLSGGLDEFYIGSPLLNLAGEVVGVVNNIDPEKGIVTAVPINQFRSIILDVLRNNIIKRSFLGIDYLDLAWVTNLDQKLAQGLNQGALVYGNPTRNTPAADAGLQANDIILSIDGQLVDKNMSLTELVQQYQPGDEISLEILRDGKTITKTTTLAVLPD